MIVNTWTHHLEGAIVGTFHYAMGFSQKEKKINANNGATIHLDIWTMAASYSRDLYQIMWSIISFIFINKQCPCLFFSGNIHFVCLLV